MKAVDGVSFTLVPSQSLGIVGESGSGKSVTALTIMRLIPSPPGRVVSGDVRYRGESLLAMSEEDVRHIRGNRIAMIFQDPMTSLNPVYRVGTQIAEPLRIHKGMSRKASLEPGGRALGVGGHPSRAPSGPRTTRTSSRAACASGP